ncbi:family 43 glycoside hydrolase [Thozetella sp. PMI_491]|nr:family 43 glycoside hydrolase [Thozetella sp. PMI_491]
MAFRLVFAGLAALLILPTLGLPINGWYADPDGRKFGDTYWVYATVSIDFDNQTWFDAFSSKDLVTWEKQEPPVFSANNSKWAVTWFWAPCTIERHGKYYFFYTANNPIANEGSAGIGVAVADTPGGPFYDLIHKPIVDKRINGANAMDPMVFVDDDGKYYLIWGGTYAMMAPLSDDMKSIVLWDDGSEVKEITPNEGFVEGSFMLKRKGIYYFMWSEGEYGTPDYRVAYAMSRSITGPFNRIGLILAKNNVADGPGHNSIFKDDDGEYYIVYHRRIIGDSAANDRVVAIDRVFFNCDGTIKPVVLT